jgi:DNA-binding protein H-NS
MFLANQKSGRRPDAENVDPDARARVAREVRELVARYAISETELRRVLDEVEHERGRQAAAENREDELERRRARERALHVARQLVEFWRIEPDELTTRQPAAAPRPGPSAVKYRHPVSGESWDGAGPQPEWLRRALGPEGYRVAELQAGPSDVTATQAPPSGPDAPGR